MHDLNSLVKLNVLLFKSQVKKRKNERREDPVICGTSNLKTTSLRVKIIFTFDLKSFSNLKTMSSHAISNGLLYVRINPTLSKTSKWQTLPTQLDFFQKFILSACFSYMPD